MSLFGYLAFCYERVRRGELENNEEELAAAQKLHIAIAGGRLKDVKAVIAEVTKGFNLEDVIAIKIEGKNSLEHAFDHRDTGAKGILKEVLSHCSHDILTTKFSDGRLPIFAGVEAKDTRFVNGLLSKKVDPNIIVGNQELSSLMTWFLSSFYTIGETPLHVAIEQYGFSRAQDGDLGVVKALINYDATRVNIPTYNGITAFEMIEGKVSLQTELSDGLLSNLDLKDATNYVDLAKHNIYLQYGVMAGKLLIVPAIKCADYKITSQDESEDFTQCYRNSFTSENVVSTLKYPAISLALQSYIAPAYTMLAISGFDLYQKGSSSSVGDALSVMSGFALSAVAYYFVGQTSIYKDHPLIIGASAVVAIPAAQLIKSTIVEGCNQLYYDAVGADSGLYTEVDL